MLAALLVLPKFDHASIDALRPILAGKVSVFVGQSGMGKSSLLNAWVPNAAALTQEYSVRLDTGKHTTTACRYFELPESWGRGETGKLGALIDSPDSKNLVWRVCRSASCSMHSENLRICSVNVAFIIARIYLNPIAQSAMRASEMK
ncbi:GTPase RsgA [Polynucleobacter necessarius]|uniref:GTPase RsgA n=1 Tax=Polynucleobacter necessarius TaxID=576610 RepID=UPI001E4CDCA1|nr:GTPase RsgA [Polynucleobacter necessarius]